jgi:hypothetical protein
MTIMGETEHARVRIGEARRVALGGVHAIKQHVIALKILRAANPVGASNALREIRESVHALLGELER